jgi:hypothetical protein
MHKISQELAYMTKHGTWEPRGDWTEAEITDSRREAAIELRNSTIGQQLFVRGGSDIFGRVLEEFGKRALPPSVAPFYETLEQAARDVLLTLPAEQEPEIPSEPVPQAPTPVEVQRAKDAQAAKDAARDQRTKDLNKFAHMVNAAIAFGGIQCITPKNGYVVLKFEENGRPHEYKYKYGDGTGARDRNGHLKTSKEYDKFMQDFEEATSRGLIA